MINRFSIFVSLLALFYYYCKDDSSNQFRQPNDINLIEIPDEISPAYYYDEYAENSVEIDSSLTQFSTAQKSQSENSSMLISSISQKY